MCRGGKRQTDPAMSRRPPALPEVHPSRSSRSPTRRHHTSHVAHRTHHHRVSAEPSLRQPLSTTTTSSDTDSPSATSSLQVQEWGPRRHSGRRCILAEEEEEEEDSCTHRVCRAAKVVSGFLIAMGLILVLYVIITTIMGETSPLDIFDFTIQREREEVFIPQLNEHLPESDDHPHINLTSLNQIKDVEDNIDVDYSTHKIADYDIQNGDRNISDIHNLDEIDLNITEIKETGSINRLTGEEISKGHVEGRSYIAYIPVPLNNEEEEVEEEEEEDSYEEDRRASGSTPMFVPVMIMPNQMGAGMHQPGGGMPQPGIGGRRRIPGMAPHPNRPFPQNRPFPRKPMFSLNQPSPHLPNHRQHNPVDRHLNAQPSFQLNRYNNQGSVRSELPYGQGEIIQGNGYHDPNSFANNHMMNNQNQEMVPSNNQFNNIHDNQQMESNPMFRYNNNNDRIRMNNNHVDRNGVPYNPVIGNSHQTYLGNNGSPIQNQGNVGHIQNRNVNLDIAGTNNRENIGKTVWNSLFGIMGNNPEGRPSNNIQTAIPRPQPTGIPRKSQPPFQISRDIARFRPRSRPGIRPRHVPPRERRIRPRLEPMSRNMRPLPPRRPPRLPPIGPPPGMPIRRRIRPVSPPRKHRPPPDYQYPPSSSSIQDIIGYMQNNKDRQRPRDGVKIGSQNHILGSNPFGDTLNSYNGDSNGNYEQFDDAQNGNYNNGNGGYGEHFSNGGGNYNNGGNFNNGNQGGNFNNGGNSNNGGNFNNGGNSNNGGNYNNGGNSNNGGNQGGNFNNGGNYNNGGNFNNGGNSNNGGNNYNGENFNNGGGNFNNGGNGNNGNFNNGNFNNGNSNNGGNYNNGNNFQGNSNNNYQSIPSVTNTYDTTNYPSKSLPFNIMLDVYPMEENKNRYQSSFSFDGQNRIDNNQYNNNNNNGFNKGFNSNNNNNNGNNFNNGFNNDNNGFNGNSNDFNNGLNSRMDDGNKHEVVLHLNLFSKHPPSKSRGGGSGSNGISFAQGRNGAVSLDIPLIGGLSPLDIYKAIMAEARKNKGPEYAALESGTPGESNSRDEVEIELFDVEQGPVLYQAIEQGLKDMNQHLPPDMRFIFDNEIATNVDLHEAVHGDIQEDNISSDKRPYDSTDSTLPDYYDYYDYYEYDTVYHHTYPYNENTTNNITNNTTTTTTEATIQGKDFTTETTPTTHLSEELPTPCW